MEAWLIVLIVVAVLCLFVFLIPYITYRIAFYSNRNKKIDPYLNLIKASYARYREKSEALVNSLTSREYEAVSIKSYDGLTLKAKYYHMSDGAPLHILFHGYRSVAFWDMSGGTEECLALSHNVLLVDHRAHGESEGHVITFGVNERLDLLSWTRYAEERFGEDVKIFIWGLSMGAATVLMSLDLPLPKCVVGAVADCPYSSPEAIIKRVARRMLIPPSLAFPFLRLGAMLYGKFRLGHTSALSSVKGSKIPVLLIHGEADKFVPCDMSRKIAEAANAAGVDLRLHIFPDASHGVSYLVDSERYRKLAMEFINEIIERTEEECMN